ncbi:MAG TPA: TIR domain-containing protein [Pseudomonadales bacterium]
MADVFISYARDDKSRVASLVSAIEHQGWSVWWDPHISPGEEFDRKITEAIRGATAVLVVWSRKSVESRWVRGEAREGARLGRLVPVRIDDADIPIDMSSLHATDLGGWTGDTQAPQAQELFRALAALIGRHRVTSAVHSEASLEAPGDRRPAICVLPFNNMSGDPEQEYFSDGITEDIITDLSKVSALSVVSRNSAFVYKGRPTEVRKVARELNVTHVLEGSVRKAGKRVRITAQLVDAARDHHVWAERFDRDLNDIFALQDEISRAIVEALKLTLQPAEKWAIKHRGTDSADAYNLYLMARQLYVSGQEYDRKRAEAIISVCTGATEFDPGYARAWALLAVGQMSLRYVVGKGGDGGLAAAERALEIDPGLGEAHAVKARVLASDGDMDNANSELALALTADRESYEVNRSAAYLSYAQDRLDDAIRHWEKTAALMPTDINSCAMLLSCYRATGNADGCTSAAQRTLSRCERVLAEDPDNAMVVSYSAIALAALGETDKARDRMERGLAIDPENWNMRYNFACALVIHLGQPEAALEMLEPFLEVASAHSISHTRIDPDFVTIRDHPRFQAMMAAADARIAAHTD